MHGVASPATPVYWRVTPPRTCPPPAASGGSCHAVNGPQMPARADMPQMAEPLMAAPTAIP
jgi:hypothetical protein